MLDDIQGNIWVRPFQVEWIELAKLANGRRHYHHDWVG